MSAATLQNPAQQPIGEYPLAVVRKHDDFGLGQQCVYLIPQRFLHGAGQGRLALAVQPEDLLRPASQDASLCRRRPRRIDDQTRFKMGESG